MHPDNGLIRDTMVSIPGGEAPVDLLRQGDSVYTRDCHTGGFAEGVVQKAVSRTVERVTEILFDDFSFCIPGDQRILTDKGPVAGRELESDIYALTVTGDMKEDRKYILGVRQWVVLAPVVVLVLYYGNAVFGKRVQLLTD